MKNKNVLLLILAGIVILAAVFILLPAKTEKINESVQTSVPEVENRSDLDSVSSDLDSTDLEQMDSELDQIDSYSSGF